MSNKKQETNVEDPETTEQIVESSELEQDMPNTEEETPVEQSELEVLQQQHGELKDKYMRMLADFENFKKRKRKEHFEFMGVAAKDTMSAILPVLDDFDRAKKISDDDATTESFTEGVQLVYNKIFNVLGQKGLKAMESNGEPFDPEFHAAITEIPAPTDEMKGKVIDTVEKGYFLNDKIIRHAKVVVGK